MVMAHPVSSGSKFSNESLLERLSCNIFITNFPTTMSAKELWNTCAKYGTLLDVYIPEKMSKMGKRFAFARYHKVYDVDMLIRNLSLVQGFLLIQQRNVAPVMVLERGTLNYQGDPVLWGVLKNSKLFQHSSNMLFLKFSSLKQWTSNFEIKDRVVWIECRRCVFALRLVFNILLLNPLKLFLKERFSIVRAKEVTGWVPDFVDDNSNEFEDPFGLEGLILKSLKKRNVKDVKESTVIPSNFDIPTKDGAKQVSEDNEPKFPPGFTPSNSDLPLNNEKTVQDNVTSPVSMRTSSNRPDFNELGQTKTNQACDGKSDIESKNKSHGGAKQDHVDSMTLSNGYGNEWFCEKDYNEGLLQVRGDQVLTLNDLLLRFNNSRARMDMRKIHGVKTLFWPSKQVNFLSLQETKMVSLDVFVVKAIWGNMYFDFATSSARDSWNNDGIFDNNAMTLLKNKLNCLKLRLKKWSIDKKSIKEHDCNTLLDSLRDIDSRLDKGEIGFYPEVSIRSPHPSDPDCTTYVSCSATHLLHPSLSSSDLFDSPVSSHDIAFPEARTAVRFGGFSILTPQRRGEPLLFRNQLDVSTPLNGFGDDLRICGADKSLGPDGFTFEFFRKFWYIVGKEVINVVKEFFNSSVFPKRCNPSFISFIPKVLDAKRLNNFRPISLIGCQYKIIGKILANHLSMVIDDIISQEQSAFIKGRQITDGPLILNEIISWCKSKKMQSLLFKVDFQKAFDSVCWDHLDDILGKLGFGNKWRGWIRGCLLSSKALVLVNGVRSSDIQSMADRYGCLATNLPFTHLGVKVGVNMSKINFWNEVVQKVTSKLSSWKAKTLSVGGRLTLIKSVLGAIPTYYLSLYKVPEGVLSHLESLRNSFLLGADVGERKITWVCWRKVMAHKQLSGLEVANSSVWLGVLKAIAKLKSKGVDLLEFAKKS
ncbi:RNA-directed DNA polymerase, eukaryota, reverse transcriptase zinc-binding domain protein [Tanacetum coccineum]